MGMGLEVRYMAKYLSYGHKEHKSVLYRTPNPQPTVHERFPSRHRSNFNKMQTRKMECEPWVWGLKIDTGHNICLMVTKNTNQPCIVHQIHKQRFRQDNTILNLRREGSPDSIEHA